MLATAGSADKTRLCRELGAAVAIDYRSTDFVQAVLEATDGRGVDVAFDAVGGDVTTSTFRCMACNGRHVIAGFASGIERGRGHVPRPVLFGNSAGRRLPRLTSTIRHVWRATGFNFPAHRDGEMHCELLAPLEQRRIRLIIGRVVPFDELPAALAALARRETVGRTVVQL